MSDKREGGAPNPLVQAFAPGRSNFERPGQGTTPLGLEREPDVSLGITLGDVSEMQPGLVRGFEIWRQFTTAFVAEFGLLSITCADGFYLERMRTNAGGAAALITVTQAAPATSSVGGTLNSSQFLPIPRLAAIQGRTAASLGAQYFIGGGVDWIQRLWIPPGFWLNLGLDTANIQTDWGLVLSGVAAV